MGVILAEQNNGKGKGTVSLSSEIKDPGECMSAVVTHKLDANL
jgi:hypothetical protein